MSLSVLAIACGEGGAGEDGGEGLSGIITADGSSTVFPLAEAVAEEFRKDYPDVEVNLGVSGTGGGFEKFCRGDTDLSNASRPITESEAAACAANGIEYGALKVAQDGLAVVVNPRSDFVDCLTTEELKRIFEPNSSVNNFQDIRSEFPDQELSLFGPGTSSGTFDYFTETIVGEEGASRTDYTASENDNVLVRGVADTPGALGYFGYAYYAENEEDLKLLGIDAGEGCVKPTDQTVKDGTYPLARPLFVYVSKNALAKPEVQAFAEYFLERTSELVDSVGYTAIDDQTLQAQMAELQASIPKQ